MQSCFKKKLLSFFCFVLIYGLGNFSFCIVINCYYHFFCFVLFYGLCNFSFGIFSFGRPLIISRMEGFSSESWKKLPPNFQDLNKFPPSFLTFFRRGFYFIFSYIRKSFNHFYFFPLNHFLLSLLTLF